jgi:dTDP-4-dehydrorhamnose reductase
MIWIIGNKGMLGRELAELLSAQGDPLVGSDREVSILDPETLSAFAEEHNPDWIVNCSAYTAVDKAEEDRDAAFALNRDGAANLARLAAERDIPLIHISTDYVFAGTSSVPLTEEAPTGPTGVYGASKLAGEEALRAAAPKHIIIRTAWLYGQHGPNFVYTMLKLMNQREALKVVDDQHGSPTWTRDLSRFILTVIRDDREAWGTYHFSGQGRCTWYGFAQEILRLGRETGLVTRPCTLTPCSSSEYPTPAKRPAWSLLSKEKARKTFGFEMAEWEESLGDFLDKLKEVGIDEKYR